ncbi:MAG: N-acetyltransferase [Candidatus Syntrophonatronum acetioxidans]|uniref:N-acetyltransferase n=1 Tax=Candidatus Syntrophonatronum acetioxidans TaxID=1795816 RepID=A0A424YCJ3_9FIRM|nr:MAG: N-acetyltransferase [Candidatus Syntrophonatronum acetioxidans]
MEKRNKEIKIVTAPQTLEEEKIVKCAEIVADAFEREGVTSYLFDFNKKNTREYYLRQTRNLVRLHLEGGDFFLMALKGEEVAGVAVINKNERLPFTKKIRSALVQVFSLIPMLTRVNLKRALSSRNAFRLSRELPPDYYTLFALAVHPHYQGQGIGKRLLSRVMEITEDNSHVSGMYLFTADEKNRLIYEGFGFEVVEEHQGGDIRVYHMFKGRN